MAEIVPIPLGDMTDEQILGLFGGYDLSQTDWANDAEMLADIRANWGPGEGPMIVVATPDGQSVTPGREYRFAGAEVVEADGTRRPFP